MQEGDISGAVWLLTSAETLLPPPSRTTEALEAKHPPGEGLLCCHMDLMVCNHQWYQQTESVLRSFDVFSASTGKSLESANVAEVWIDVVIDGFVCLVLNHRGCHVPFITENFTVARGHAVTHINFQTHLHGNTSEAQIQGTKQMNANPRVKPRIDVRFLPA